MAQSLLFGVVLCILVVSNIAVPFIWPLPQVVTNGSQTVTLCNSNFKFTTSVQSNILNNAIARFNKYISNAAPVLRTRKVLNIIKSSDAALCSGTITVASNDESLSLNTNENYTLSVDSTSIKITSQTIYGAMYGLVTLEQLIRYDSMNTKSNIISYIPWNIEDYPVYNHRAVMLDSSRNFLSVSVIKQVLDGMAMNKLNVFHWHLIDAQAFPFYSKSHPELSEKGAYGPDKIYKESNITDIVNYAKTLGIRVIPEFDTPGHTFAISYGDPDIMECVDVADNTPAYCPEPPCGYLRVNYSSSVSTILDVYLDAYELFGDSYFHIGADEVKDACWGKNTNSMYVQWITTMCNNVHSIGKRTPILWSGNVDVTADIGQNGFDIVIQIWDNAQDKVTALKNGFKVIDSTYTSYYLDCGFGNWLSGGNSWCDPYKTWGNIYNHSLTEGVPTQYLKDILGGEVCLWGESVDDFNIFPRLWPRAAAGAERWWRDLPLTDLDTSFQRLAIQRDWMVHNGIIASPVQPEFCTLHPEYCNYYRDVIENTEPNWITKLREYKLDKFIEEFESNGWDMIELWGELDYNTAHKMGFKSGHWVKFQHLLKSINK